MLGLRKDEGFRFNKYFEEVQKEARKSGCIYYADCGEGKDGETKDMDLEDMFGWLIPIERAKEFEKVWLHNDKKLWSDDYNWDDYCTWLDWEILDAETNEIRIIFKKAEYYGPTKGLDF